MDTIKKFDKVSETIPNIMDLRPVFIEYENRKSHQKRVELIDFKRNKELDFKLFEPGTITALVFRKNKETKERIKELLKENKIDHLIEFLFKSYEKREIRPLKDGVKALVKSDVFGELSYNSKILASNIFIPDDMEVAIVPFPYNGGNINEKEFQLAEFYKDKKTELDAIIIKSTPKLSKHEKEALKLIPSDMTDINIGKAALCYAITAVGVVWTVLAATSFCPGMQNDFNVSLSEKMIDKLGPIASAKELLRLRREYIEAAIN